MEKFTGGSIQEFRKWAAENWKEIEAAYEEACEKYLEEQRENLTDYSLPNINTPDDLIFIPTDAETVFVLPTPKNKPIKICFAEDSLKDSLGEVDYKEIIDKAFKEEN